VKVRMNGDRTVITVCAGNMMDKKGTVLITTILVISLLSVLGMSLITLLLSRMTYAQMQADRLKAFYLAEAGISRSIWELRSDIDIDGDGPGNIPESPLGGGTFRARHDFRNSTITGTGTVNKVARTVQIKYSLI